MPPIRIAAILVLASVPALAVASLFDDESGLSMDPWSLLFFMAVVTLNAGGVLALTREGRRLRRFDAPGLWLVVTGAVFALVLAADPIWLDLVLPEPSLLNFASQIGTALATDILLAALGLVSLASGWALWGVPRVTTILREA